MEKLSERCYFCLLFIDVYANSITLAAFLFASEKMLLPNGDRAVTESVALLWCLVVFILRASVQIKSQGMQYFTDFWGWIQLTSTFLLGLALQCLYRYNETPKPLGNAESDRSTRSVMILAGGFIILQFVS